MFFCCCCNWAFFWGGGVGEDWVELKRWNSIPSTCLCFFFPSIRSAKIYVFVWSNLLASCFCKFGPVKNCYQKKKTIQDLSNEFLVQFLFKNLTILLEGIRVIKFNCGLLLDSRDTNTSSFCRLPASNLGCGRWGSSNLFFYKFNIPCTMLSWLSLCHSQLL